MVKNVEFSETIGLRAFSWRPSVLVIQLGTERRMFLESRMN